MDLPGPFTSPTRAGEILPRILADPEGEGAVALVRLSADPDMALLNLSRFLEAKGGLPTNLPDAVTLFAGSQSMSEAVVRNPALLEEVLEDPVLPDREALLERVHRHAEVGPGDPRLALLRFVRAETLRLLIEDLAGRKDVEDVARHLSLIAEAAVEEALSLALREARARHAPPREESGAEATMTVIGFGKLGGQELNYSSDIDLVFLHSGEGRPGAPEASRSRRNREFFTRVVERTRHLLADPTPEGHCYRVDLRLRPEGAAGALTRTVTSAVEYYFRTGRTWERQALIKARPVAGDRELGSRRFLEPLARFVYGAPLTFEEITSIKGQKTEIERRHPDPRQVKAGRGGIRDVEFTVQFLQLLHGKEEPTLRLPGTLPALRRLSDLGALTHEESRDLEASYLFLRKVEHRLQTLHEVRTHVLPADPEGVARLARRMGLGDGGRDPRDRFQTLHARHTGAARNILDRLFHNLFVSGSDDAALATNYVLDPEAHREGLRRWLARRGFADPEKALSLLARLGASPHPRARKFLASLCPDLLLRSSRTPEPDRCLRNLERLIDSIGAPATFYQLLAEYPDILGVFCDLCGWSQHLTDAVVRNPAMIDAFVDSLVVSPRAGRQPWDDLPLAEIETEEDPERHLHDLKDLSLLRIGVRDIQAKANTQNTAGDLTRLAERILAFALGICETRVRERRGPPPSGARFAILGMGKLGAGEMSYASDLDLAFVLDAPDDPGRAREFHERVAQGLMRLLTRVGPRGRLYEADARVRPYGRSGPLLITLDGFTRYYRDHARIPELQMLTKARAVAGDPGLGREVEETIRDTLYGRPPRPGIRVGVLAMRETLESRTKGRDVKRGFGGLVDIEFFVEALKLEHGHAHPSLRTTGTLSGLAAAHREGLIDFRKYESLLTSLQFLRSVESRMRIVYDMAQDRIPESKAERDRLARRLGYVDTPTASAGCALLQEYDYHTRRTRTETG